MYRTARQGLRIVHWRVLSVRQFLPISVLMFAVFCIAACSTPASTTTGSPAAAGPASFAGRSGQSADAAVQSYRQAVDDLIAATRVRSSLLSANLRELEPCKFALEIAQGRQSVLQYSFDVRQLNLNESSEVAGQSAEAEFVARDISCAENQGNCVNYVGMQIDSFTIVSPTTNDLERAGDALRRAQSVCLQAPPP